MDDFYNCKWVEDNFSDLVSVQDEINSMVDSLDYECDVEEIKFLLSEEKRIIDCLLNNLDKLFGVKSRWGFKRFTIRKGLIGDRYEISPPLFLDKSCKEYVVLERVLVEMHKKYFLSDGMIGYAYSSVKSHMWEVPCRVERTPFIKSLER